jgi:hypothetical protein
MIKLIAILVLLQSCAGSQHEDEVKKMKKSSESKSMAKPRMSSSPSFQKEAASDEIEGGISGTGANENNQEETRH